MSRTSTNTVQYVWVTEKKNYSLYLHLLTRRIVMARHTRNNRPFLWVIHIVVYWLKFWTWILTHTVPFRPDLLHKKNIFLNSVQCESKFMSRTSSNTVQYVYDSQKRRIFLLHICLSYHEGILGLDTLGIILRFCESYILYCIAWSSGHEFWLPLYMWE